MSKIIIKRNADKFCDKADVRQLGKAGRLARMFAESNSKRQSKPKGDYKGIRTEITFSTAEIEYRPLKHGEKGIHTVRAKEKIKRGCRELIRF